MGPVKKTMLTIGFAALALTYVLKDNTERKENSSIQRVKQDELLGDVILSDDKIKNFLVQARSMHPYTDETTIEKRTAEYLELGIELEQLIKFDSMGRRLQDPERIERRCPCRCGQKRPRRCQGRFRQSHESLRKPREFGEHCGCATTRIESLLYTTNNLCPPPGKPDLSARKSRCGPVNLGHIGPEPYGERHQ